MSAAEQAPFDPQQYERLSTGTVPGYAALQELVALAAAAVAPSSRPAVLDLGCGTGAGLLALARALPDPQLTACDPAPPMIATARTRCEAAGVKAQLVVGDLSAVAHDAQFDVVVCTLVLHFVRPEARAPLLSAIRARLRSGGSLVISTLGRSIDPAVQAVWTKLRRHHAISNNIAPA
jgi:2-polyprenyl-3-methyl-5-hydroxy-6-metoxy-1,4-benzoquinol methylase